MDGTPPSTWIQRTRRVVALIEDGLLATLLTLMIAVATAQIVMRNLWDSGLDWGDPFTKVLVLWVALLGAMVAARYNNHIHIDVLSRFLPDNGKAGIQVVGALIAALVCGQTRASSRVSSSSCSRCSARPCSRSSLPPHCSRFIRREPISP